MSVPDNVDFLPGAALEMESLGRLRPDAHAAVLAALISLGRDGPPADTAYVPVQAAPFPNTLAYRFETAGVTVVFESNQRVVMKTRAGMRVVRALRGGGAEARYTIWAILS